MRVKNILKKHNYFISSDGFVFFIKDGKEIKITPRQSEKSKRVFVEIDGKEYDLFNLMFESFFGDTLSITKNISFKITDDLRIPLGNIKIRHINGGSNVITPQEMEFINYFKCARKASSANSRAHDKITAIEVFRILKLHEYKCVYCRTQLFNLPDWHLDHFESISKGGANRIENLVPSCPTCNKMKGALNGKRFVSLCKVISSNYLFKGPVEKLSKKFVDV